MQNSVCCTCLQQKPAMFFPLSGGTPGQPSFRDKLTFLTSKADHLKIVNAVICHNCSCLLEQAYKFKIDCEMTATRFFSYLRKISAVNKPVHCFVEVQQAAGLNLVLHKIEDTVNNYSLIMGVDDKENGYVTTIHDSDDSCYIVSDDDSVHIEISDTERSPSPLLEPIMPTLSPQHPSSNPTEFQCKQCTMTFFTRQNLKRHKRIHDQALDTINDNIKHHMITAEDVRSIIGIGSNQRPSITYNYFLENALEDHTYYCKNTQLDSANSTPPVLSPQTGLAYEKERKSARVPLYADLVGASGYKYNPNPKTKYQKNRKKRRYLKKPTSFSISSTWEYNPHVVLIKDETLEARIRYDESNGRRERHIINKIPKCVHNFLEDSCRMKTTLLYGNVTKCTC